MAMETMTAAIGGRWLAALTTIGGDGDRPERGRTMAEFSGDISGAAVANGANSGGRQGLRRTAAGGGFFWDVKRAYHTE